MRFSLQTFLLGCLTVGGVVGIWVRNGAWVRDERIYFRRDLPENYFERDWTQRLNAPDGRRILTDLRWLGGPADLGNTRIVDEKGKTIYDFGIRLFDKRFGDNDTILCVLARDKVEYELYRRRYPEWWWGHFYRVEVWVTVVCGGGLIWRLLQRKRKSSVEKNADGMGVDSCSLREPGPVGRATHEISKAAQRMKM